MFFGHRRGPAPVETAKCVVATGFPGLAALALVAVIPLVGCLYRSHTVTIHRSTAPLRSATNRELVERINTQAATIQTLSAAVEIKASVGGSERGNVTEYQEISGHIWGRKPSSLRIIGLFPIVKNCAFDMVSQGQKFELWIPSKNQFVVGGNEVHGPSALAVDKLQPQAIYNVLLLEPIDLQTDIAVLEQGEHTVKDESTQRLARQPDYTLDIIKRTGRGWHLSRKIVFDRTDLQPHEQIMYDEDGTVMTDAHYDQFKDLNGVFFPTRVQIWRPQEEYSITLTLDKLTVNQPLSEDQFILKAPPGARLGYR